MVQKVISFGIGKFSTWRGKCTAKQVEIVIEPKNIECSYKYVSSVKFVK